MPYPRRVFEPEGIYHVASRGSDRRPIFWSDADRELFLDQLEKTVERFQLPCIAYCLMGNHYHLIVQTPDERLSKTMQELNRDYSRRFNFVHKRSAHLFRNRFMAQLIDSDSYLLTACRYVAHNPVRVGLCETPLGWKWSSYQASAGFDPAPKFLDEQLLRAAIGGDTRWRRRYREFVEVDAEVVPPSGFAKLGA
ncbi:MAG: transposase [Gaiellaceae bacterium]|jgi:REP element-mobilizing transposase RayT